MEGEAVGEKVYVALGNDLQEGYKTLDWTLKRWGPNAISIVILHVSSISDHFVYTPFGKLPASTVSEDKLEVLRKFEKEKMEELLSKYSAYCGKTKAQIHRVEKQDDPIHKLMVDLICSLGITRLVMGITFMKSSSWRSKSPISGSFYIQKHKPDFCEFFVVCGGKMVPLKRGNYGREKGNVRAWLGKMFQENPAEKNFDCSSSSTVLDSDDRWERDFQELEKYFQELLSLNDDLDEETTLGEDEGDVRTCSMEADMPGDMSAEEKIHHLKAKISEAQEKTKQNRGVIKDNAERYAKAQSALRLCNGRAEELESRMKGEAEKRIEMEKSLESEKERLQEIARDVEEKRSRLSSAKELQRELSEKLQSLATRRCQAESELEKAVSERAEMVREIELLRQQRDVFRRRIEFCKEKDAISRASRSSCSGEQLPKCGYREYAGEDVRLATDDFSDRLRIKSGGKWTNVYRGRVNHTTVAVKVLSSVHGFSEEAFRAKVELLNEIRHPHLVSIIGYCSEPQCMIFEYMHNGNLRDNLFTLRRNSQRKSKILKWHDRIRVAHQVCSGLTFLHSAKPKPMIHGRLTPSKILLDRNLVAKISGFGLTQQHEQPDMRPDVRAFGVLLMHLLTGRNWPGLLKAMKMNPMALLRDLDEMGGKWPLDMAKEVAGLATKCLSAARGPDTELGIDTVKADLDEIRKKADELVVKGGYEEVKEGGANDEDPDDDIPSIFFCPILQEVMRNPHVAADGFSYELEAIDEWVKKGRDTSPMTNLRLEHQFFTPNHTLRSLIQDWLSKRPSPSSS